MLPSKLKFLEIKGSCDALFWDFDGVIMDSMSVRDEAFRHVLRDYPSDLVDALVTWHKANGGLSRYVKFARFQEVMLGIPKDEVQIKDWAAEFSRYCTARLCDPAILIEETVLMLPILAEIQPMHIVSGSDGVELNALCQTLGLSRYFRSIHGSPTPKIDLVRQLLDKHDYRLDRCWLIGDSKNDLEAARTNSIGFIGFGEHELRQCSDIFWD